MNPSQGIKEDLMEKGAYELGPEKNEIDFWWDIRARSPLISVFLNQKSHIPVLSHTYLLCHLEQDT